MPGLLTLIGSGEVSAGMARVHRRLLAPPCPDKFHPTQVIQQA